MPQTIHSKTTRANRQTKKQRSNQPFNSCLCAHILQKTRPTPFWHWSLTPHVIHSDLFVQGWKLSRTRKKRDNKIYHIMLLFVCRKNIMTKRLDTTPGSKDPLAHKHDNYIAQTIIPLDTLASPGENWTALLPQHQPSALPTNLPTPPMVP